MPDERNDPYRTASPPPPDDREAIARAYARRRTQALGLVVASAAAVLLACVALALVSRGRLLCLFFPIVPFFARGAFARRRFGLVFPGRHRFQVRPHPTGVEVEVGAMLAQLAWSEIAGAVMHGPDHGAYVLSGSTVLELRSGLCVGVPATAEGYDRLRDALGERGLLRRARGER